MAYGKLRVDTLTYDNAGSDVDVDISTIPSGAAIAAKADIASPALTGTPTAPTAAQGTNTTQVATTEYVQTELTVGNYLDSADLGVTVQTYDAATVKTNVAQTFTAGQRGAISTLTSGATVTPDFAVANNFTLTLDQNLTINNPSSLVQGQSGSIFLVQDGTGNRTASWDTYWDFAGGTPPTLSTAANAVDRIDYVVRLAAGTPSIHAVATLNYS
jgi:hypothetical protein